MSPTTPEDAWHDSVEAGGGKPRVPLEKRIADLEAEIARLKAEVASLKKGPPPRLSRRGRFLVGLFYLGFVAQILSNAIRQPFWVTFSAVLCGAVFTSGLAIWWLTLWALRKDAQPGQFTIGSLMFLTAFVALYFSAISWLVSLLPLGSASSPRGSVFAWAALAMGVLGLISIPFVLFVADGIVWAGVWVVKRLGTRRPTGTRR